MKIIGIGLCAAVLAGGIYMHGPLAEPNVYAMPADEVYSKLKHADVDPSGTGPFGRLDVAVSGKPGKSVKFSAQGSHAAYYCSAILTAVDASKTRVDATCDGGAASDGAAAGIAMNLRRNAFIELLDSTLTGRAFSPDKGMGSTAARWPADVVERDASYGHAVGEAIKMQAETEKMIDEVNEEQARTKQNAGVSFRPGQPMVSTSGR